MDQQRNRICPVERASSLDTKLRRWLQNPGKIVGPFVQPGMTVLDVGCGPGYFTIEMAKQVGGRGKVIAADLQEGMLQALRAKIKGTELEARIRPVLCDQGKINVSDAVDFILAFYMVHEVPDKQSFFRQLKTILSQNGQCLLVEPKMFHVSRTEFNQTTRIAEESGFTIHQGPRLMLSWSALLTGR
ncbi:MAG: class I SAM-dependent methyltransferase [Phycisphaeraceae bacterium]|nr:class I SAM-dependent methyltransferase [Phycisphaeraceae bacterium]